MGNKSYRSTLKIANTKFPMRADIIEQQVKIIKFWQNNDINKKIFDYKHQTKEYILHFGPPYVNGSLHLGHGLNLIAKCLAVRHKQQLGYQIGAKAGFDCHGLPIEMKIVQQQSELENQPVKTFEQIVNLRTKCAEYSSYWIKQQKKTMINFGLLIEDDHYSTLQETKKIYECFSRCILNNLVFIQNVPMLWSYQEHSVIADVDTEHRDVESTAVTLGLEITSGIYKGKKIAIWTTTPWSLFDNTAVAYNKIFTYVLIDNVFYCKQLAPETQNDENILEVSGYEFESCYCQHPLHNKSVPMIHSDHVISDTGTGFVHIAPAHGPEDYQLSQEYSLDIVDSTSIDGYIVNVDGVEDTFMFDDQKILTYFQSKIIQIEQISHSYPFSVRGNNRLYYRSSEQVFLKIKNINKINLDKTLTNVNFYPHNVKKEFIQLMKDRPYWCVSRNRYWGVPLGIFINKQDKTILINKNLQNKILETIDQDINLLFDESRVMQLLEGIVDNPQDYRYYPGVLDVWFDSACVSLLDHLKLKPGLYLEGCDQVRAWFQSSLLLRLLLNESEPFHTVVSHGIVVDGNGYKLSKSKGNSKDLDVLIKEQGVEILRIWVMFSDYQDSRVHFSDAILDGCKQHYRKLRNFARYLLSILETYQMPTRPVKLPESYQVICDYCNHHYSQFVYYMERFNTRKAWNTLIEMVNFLSGCFFNAIKTILYCYDENNSLYYHSILQTCLYIFQVFMKMITVILPLTSEEIHQYCLNNNIQIPNFTNESVHLNTFQVEKTNGLYKKLLDLMSTIDDINSRVANLCTNGIKNYVIEVDTSVNLDLLKTVFYAKKIFTGTQLKITELTDQVCPRCDQPIEYINLDSPVCICCARVLDRQNNNSNSI